MLISVVVQTEEERKAADNMIRTKIALNSETKTWSCVECGYSHLRIDVMRKHVDAQHMNLSYSCHLCHKVSTTQHALKQHITAMHK